MEGFAPHGQNPSESQGQTLLGTKVGLIQPGRREAGRQAGRQRLSFPAESQGNGGTRNQIVRQVWCQNAQAFLVT